MVATPSQIDKPRPVLARRHFIVETVGIWDTIERRYVCGPATFKSKEEADEIAQVCADLNNANRDSKYAEGGGYRYRLLARHTVCLGG